MPFGNSYFAIEFTLWLKKITDCAIIIWLIGDEMKKGLNKAIERMAIIVVTLSIIFTFSGCKKTITSYHDMTRINNATIFNQKADKNDRYYIVIYSNTCDFCKQLEPSVVEYYNYVKNKPFGSSCSSTSPIYVINLDAKLENTGLLVNSDSEYENFVGTSNYQDIHFSTAPALIEVSQGVVTKLISSKTTLRPMSEIKTLLTTLMN